MQKESFEVEAEQEGERLDKFLSIIYPDFSRAFFQKLIKNNQVAVNDKVQKASYCVKIDDSRRRRALEVLERASLRTGKIYLLEADGALREVTE